MEAQTSKKLRDEVATLVLEGFIKQYPVALKENDSAMITALSESLKVIY